MQRPPAATHRRQNEPATTDHRVTYYVALPFSKDEKGDLVAGEAAEFQGSRAATASAHAMAIKYGGAVAFSRRGDPAVGEFEDAVLLVSVGDVPGDLADLTG